MKKKTIVITGSTKGIGHGLALEFLKQNHQVVINGRKAETVDAIVLKLQNSGFEVIGVAGDVTDHNTTKAIIKSALAHYQKIDIWINNAGIPQSNRLFHELDNNEINRVISVNVIAMMQATKTVLNFFKEQGFGKIFNMEGFGSDGRIMEKLTLYGTSKRALNYFTKSVSKEVKEKNIQIGILSPGMVRTDFLENSMNMGSQEDKNKTQKIVDILAEDVEVVTKFLVKKMLVSYKQYDRINYLTTCRFLPKLFRLIFVR